MSRHHMFHSLSKIENFLSIRSPTTLKSLTKYHAYIITTGNHSTNVFISSKLISLYAYLNNPHSSKQIFDSFNNHKDIFIWNSIIKSFFSNKMYSQSLNMYNSMRTVTTYLPNQFTFPMIVSACAEIRDIVYGSVLHGLVFKVDVFDVCVTIGSSFVYMYSKCGCVDIARKVFDEMFVRDVVAWTALVIGYVWNDESENGLKCVCEMYRVCGNDDERPNFRTLEGAFQACSDLEAVYSGRCLHGAGTKSGLVFSSSVQSAMCVMYSKCGTFEEAYMSFCDVSVKDIKLWTTIIGVYGKWGRVRQCLCGFMEMLVDGIEPDPVVVSCVLSGLANSTCISAGKIFHGFMVRRNYDGDEMVHNALVSMYCKFGLVMYAEKLFCRTNTNMITLNTMISAYTHSGDYNEAFSLFNKIVLEGIKPNIPTLISMLSACAHLASFEKGEEILKYIDQEMLLSNIPLATALVDMYAKCGQLEKSEKIFYKMTEKDLISWNVMISGYGMHGDTMSAINTFRQMELSNVKPNELTFLALLSACNHAGLVDEGKYLFGRMGDYVLKPTLKHYTCMVDLLGRSGYLVEAENLVLSMPIVPDGGLWGALLSACKTHNNPEMGIRIAKHAIECDPANDGYYVIISNLYDSIGMWEEAEKMRNVMKTRGVEKAVGWSVV